MPVASNNVYMLNLEPSILQGTDMLDCLSSILRFMLTNALVLLDAVNNTDSSFL
jgi:hypothetical protein